mmetsp:Transcript_107740/g.347825  ORF Transcript_107740/g.347825 Transcript_107740/m.347825 type:complete len:316 (-) Transcript_107740:107-1054(-)
MASVSVSPEDAAGMELMSVRVKNTFIHVAVESTTTNARPASLPPSLRLGACAGASAAKGRGGRAASPRAKAFREEDVSTEADTSREEDASTDAGTAADEEQSVDAEAPPGAEVRGHCGEAAAPGAVAGAMVCQPATLLGNLLFAAARAPPRRPPAQHQLNSSAKAWTPGKPLGLLGSPTFAPQLEAIVAAARAVLLSCLCVVGVEVTKGANGWSINARVRPQDFQQKEVALTRAKEAFLAAAEASQNIYLLGYCARPFVATPMGFAARFGAVPDEHSACWGLLKHGVCRFGHGCHWQHPELQATVNVAIMLAESA